MGDAGRDEHLFSPCPQSCAVLAGSGRGFEALIFQLSFLSMLSCIVVVSIPVTWLTVRVQVAPSCHITVTHLLGSGCKPYAVVAAAYCGPT